MKKLTPKQEKFIKEYMIDLNGQQAAIRAGYSVKSAKEIASEMLTKPNIQAALGKKQAEQSKRLGISADRVMNELAKIGFANITDLANVNTAKVNLAASRDDTAAIQSVRVKTIPTNDGKIVEREIKTHDKIKALENIGRRLGMWNDKLSVDGNISLNFLGENELPEDNE